jgi:hypothetical protein
MPELYYRLRFGSAWMFFPSSVFCLIQHASSCPQSFHASTYSKSAPPGYKYHLSPSIHFICSFFPSSSLFFIPLSFSFLYDAKRTNQRTNEQTNERTNGNSPFLTSWSSFAHHYQLFTFCITPLSFDTRSTTTMTTTIETTTMLMPTPPQLHVAQKGSFKIFKCEKHGETLEFFLDALILSIVDSLAIVPKKCTIPWPIPNAYYYWYFR